MSPAKNFPAMVDAIGSAVRRTGATRADAERALRAMFNGSDPVPKSELAARAAALEAGRPSPEWEAEIKARVARMEEAHARGEPAGEVLDFDEVIARVDASRDDLDPSDAEQYRALRATAEGILRALVESELPVPASPLVEGVKQLVSIAKGRARAAALPAPAPALDPNLDRALANSWSREARTACAVLVDLKDQVVSLRDLIDATSQLMDRAGVPRAEAEIDVDACANDHERELAKTIKRRIDAAARGETRTIPVDMDDIRGQARAAAEANEPPPAVVDALNQMRVVLNECAIPPWYRDAFDHARARLFYACGSLHGELIRERMHAALAKAEAARPSGTAEAYAKARATTKDERGVHREDQQVTLQRFRATNRERFERLRDDKPNPEREARVRAADEAATAIPPWPPLGQVARAAGSASPRGAPSWEEVERRLATLTPEERARVRDAAFEQRGADMSEHEATVLDEVIERLAAGGLDSGARAVNDLVNALEAVEKAATKDEAAQIAHDALVLFRGK